MELQNTSPLRRGLNHGKNSMRACLAACICIIAMPALGAAEQQPTDVLAVAAEEELDAVIVQGTALWKLRQDIVRTEEQFYKLYNELNKNKDYEVHCQKHAPLGTHIQRAVCRIAFYEDAEAEAAQALMRGEPALSPQLVMLERQSDYRKNALAIINGDQRLLKLVRLRQDAEKKYYGELKRRFQNGRWISF